MIIDLEIIIELGLTISPSKEILFGFGYYFRSFKSYSSSTVSVLIHNWLYNIRLRETQKSASKAFNS